MCCGLRRGGRAYSAVRRRARTATRGSDSSERWRGRSGAVERRRERSLSHARLGAPRRPALAMHLVLSLPGLLAPGAVRDRPAPHLARLIALAGTPEREPDGLDAALAARYGIQRAHDWPLAAIRAAALGVDTGTAYWFAADPVTLEAGSNDVRLSGAVRDLGSDDAAALVAALN